VLRQRVWIDNSVQGVLIGRIVLYWLCGMVYFGLGSACFQFYEHRDWTFSEHAVALAVQFGPWLPSLILFMPLVIYDIVRMSNLFVGPIFHLRRHLNTLVRDPECHPLKFREDDYWHDLEEPVNALHTEILNLRAQIAHLEKAQIVETPAVSPTTQVDSPMETSQA